ncbi:MAG: V-type ATP synthase subunit B, partial [Candidatus Methanoplasma sp.]|nr:V-type ATP synthase subunit B [Candidatus Methanoplasma sp.]
MAKAKVSKEYKTVSQIAGPLVFVKKTEPVGYQEMVSVRLSDGSMKRGQVLDTSDEIVVVQIFEGTSGIDRQASVRFLGDTMKMPVSRDMLGRILTGAGEPLDGGARIVPEKELDIVGAAINPWARDSPADFIQTGISTIDGMNTLVRGQKLPIFSGSGLPHNDIALQIARQAKVLGENEEFAVVFIALGITNEEKQRFMKEFERTGALKSAVVFLNLADDPAVERIVTTRLGLTTAE